MEKLPILITKNVLDLNQFVEFWSRLYSYPLENLYNERIKKNMFDNEDIQNLFVWKNGMDLSLLKQNSIDGKIKLKLKLINELKTQKNVDLESFKNKFSNLTTVWKIFLLHIIKPDKYPIYDQHIHRAFNYIHNEDYSRISSSYPSNNEKEKFYFNTYLPFIKKQKHINLKKLDEAFFSFGQFINTKKNLTLIK
ncbi:hypothetical protein [Draconibacterium orientale]|uniref:hypothetical protein n=1 Tax=Draconibacterium orientale TaxID=1168034 RepID=UPI002A0A3FEB|nr:hypothetical protein [Draconibacterium orientale]